MELEYKSNKLKKQLTQSKEMVKAFGIMAKKVNQRMAELTSADNLSVMSTIPAAHCHQLKGNRKGQIAVTISGNYRLIFIPDHDPVPLLDDGGLDLQSVTAIKIIETEDYHRE
ncbi:MAG TPA: type II toxin-antitoxin system RelE/ParE family toxin [Fulvivirga sp.]|nr:type II toxin-antitoxin system RelE/ParE family toxin [Fulvivirga sp.]